MLSNMFVVGGNYPSALGKPELTFNAYHNLVPENWPL